MIVHRPRNDFLFVFDIDPERKTLILCMTDDVCECVAKNVSDVIGVPVTR